MHLPSALVSLPKQENRVSFVFKTSNWSQKMCWENQKTFSLQILPFLFRCHWPNLRSTGMVSEPGCLGWNVHWLLPLQLPSFASSWFSNPMKRSGSHITNITERSLYRQNYYIPLILTGCINMPINCPLVPKLDLWLRTINTDLCVCLFFSALLSLLLWCFNTIAVAIHISGLIEVFVHLVCRKLVFFLFLFGCRRLAIWILLLFQLLLLLLLQLLALFGLVLFFF